MNNLKKHIYLWYSANKRELPWRETANPYKIWLSEIILQQTRIAQGISYYDRFIEEFPTIFELAKAPEDQVLKLWQGLGYYTRARNLHSTSKFIVKYFKGVFPDDYKTILSLKGVGQYTAAAVASIAFDLPYPTVDGNVYRVISRYFGITEPIDSDKGKKQIHQIAEELMPKNNCGFHNQALMEFGALQCVPQSPKCNLCPLKETCFAVKMNLQNELPIKSKKTKQRNRYFYYYLIESGDSVFLEKREGNDIWRNLYQLPLLETNKELSEAELLNTEPLFFNQSEINIKSISAIKKHVLSHQIIYARLIHVESNHTKSLIEHFIQTNKKDIFNFAVPKLVEEFLNEARFGEN